MAREASWKCGGKRAKKKGGLSIVYQGPCAACCSESNLSKCDLFSTDLVSQFPPGLISAYVSVQILNGGEDI